MKTIQVKGISVALEVIREDKNFTTVKATAFGEKGVRQVNYEVDRHSGEIFINQTMGSVFKILHEEWRNQGVMKRVEIPREVFGIPLGGRPYVRRFFLKEIWKDEVQ
jgi:hypothetical protein